MTDRELMFITGWGKKKLRGVYQRGTWAGVASSDQDLFLFACGLRKAKQRRYIWLLKRTWKKGMDGIRNLRHLRRSKIFWREHQIRTLLRMVERVLRDEYNEPESAG